MIGNTVIAARNDTVRDREREMWIIIRTAKGKNSFLTKSGDWSQDRNDAERFDQFDYAVYYRDKEIPPRERRGVGVVKFA